MKTIALAASVAALTMFASLSQASSVSYDQNLVSPNASAANPVYFGSGNPNGGFTVDNENGVELGLRAKYRQNGAVIDTNSNLYTVVPGAQTNTTSGGNGAATNRAAWNWEFSIDLRPNGVGTLSLSDIINSTTLTFTDLTTSTVLFSGSPFAGFPDTSSFGASGKNSPFSVNDWAAQNSENGVFFPGFDMNAPHLYEVTLDVKGVTGAPIASNTIDIQVAPLPSAATMGLGMLALVGAAGLLRKKLAVA
ncbi:MAG: hypothetical protein ACTHN5_18070 [Phycisphaerae bacterium]